MCINKRQAKLIMQLPDGYEWEFINDGKFIAGYSGSNILVYEIVDDELIKLEVSSNVTYPNNKDSVHGRTGTKDKAPPTG